MREFRSHLPLYLLASSPVAITKHGETVGFYIPTRTHSEQRDQDKNSLKVAASKLDKLLKEHGLTEDALLAEYRVLRKSKHK